MQYYSERHVLVSLSYRTNIFMYFFTAMHYYSESHLSLIFIIPKMYLMQGRELENFIFLSQYRLLVPGEYLKKISITILLF
jgi:hypothetical protein